jgi:hypothetical protein
VSRFRKQYRTLTANESAHVEMIKDAAEMLELLINQTPEVRQGDDNELARMRSLALTNLEQAVMWAVKAAT